MKPSNTTTSNQTPRQELEIKYLTYARKEPDKRVTGLILEDGDTVTLTGIVHKSDCPFTTCDCGGPREWVQIAINSELRWILREAIE